MTQINRKTAIALAKEAGMAGMLTDVVCSLEEIHRLCNLAVAHSRKDAEPVGYGLWIEHDGQLCLQWPVRPTKEKCQLDLQMYAPNIGYEIRAIFTHPQEADKPNPLDDLDCAKMMVRSAGYSLVSADFIAAFAEFIQDWRKGDFDLPKLAALDVKACFDAWQKEVNQNEVKPVLQAQERVPMTTADMVNVVKAAGWPADTNDRQLVAAFNLIEATEAHHGITPPESKG